MNKLSCLAVVLAIAGVMGADAQGDGEPRTPRRARPGSTIAGAIRSASMRSSAS